MTPIRILIADDSVVSRQMLKSVLSSVPELEVVAVASNGRLALEKLQHYQVDLVILDVEMPELDGLETLQEIRRQYGNLPVIMFSAMTEAGAAITIRALSLGADDYVTKPSTRDRQQDEVKEQILSAFVPRILALHRRRLRDGRLAGKPRRMTIEAAAAPAPSQTASQASAEVPAEAPAAPRPRKRVPLGQLLQRIDVVGIGISTGGPNALAELIPALPADFPVPLVLVQHMPPIFTRYLAERLDDIAAVRVVEASDGMPLEAGCVYVAQGGLHLDLARRGERVCIALNSQPPENSCRPAVDLTFRAMASLYGSAALGVIMTGMGQDGLRGCEALVEAGGSVLTQDEATSTIWGMPAYVSRAGLAEKTLALGELGPEIVKRVRWGR